ncbi:7674_t:CDS:2, partial [Funneliformis geosporum]
YLVQIRAFDFYFKYKTSLGFIKVFLRIMPVSDKFLKKPDKWKMHPELLKSNVKDDKDAAAVDDSHNE